MNVSVVSSILTVAFILAPDGRSESPFPNSDFEMETFTNWPVHDGWQLHGGLKTLSGLPHQRLADQTDGDLVGFHSASSYDLREGLATFYTGKKIGAYPKRLASDPFRVTQPFLAFLMTGSLESGKNFIGMDFNADGKPDVSLEDATWRMVRKQCRHAALFCVDLRDHLGKTGTFVANVESGWLSVDRLSLESAPPLMIQSLKVTQTGRQAKAAIKVINPWSVESNGTLAVEVLDFYGKKIAEEGFEVRELGKDDPGSQNVGHTFHFSVGHGPDFRIRARLFSDSGTLLSVFHHRWTAERLSQDRPKVLIDDGWKVSVSDDAKIELPLPDAAWSAESPIMPSGSFGYRSHRWKKYQNRAQVWYRREFESPSRTLSLKRSILNLQGGGDGLFSVFVNGKEIATRSIYRYNNYSFDLSATVTSGSNELVIRFRNPDRYLRGPDKAYIVPVREYWGVPMGLFGHAWLVSRPEVFADQILIDPSLEKKRLTLRASILNAGPHQARATVSASVFDPEGREVLKFREQNLEAGTDEPIDLEMVKRWRRPILWSLESPRLLRLRLTVTANGQTDVTDTRFGFREISIKGRDVLLNGAHLTIFDGTMPVSENFRFLKRVFGQNATRTPWVSYDSVLISDEEGILTRMVNGNIPIPKKADIRKRYWQKVTELQLSKTRYLYNNPSVWMWVVGNELGGAGYLRKPLLETFRPLYTNLIKDIQLLDPMRPVTSDGDLDFWGTSKLLNAHYPHEYGRSFGLPNLAYFSDRGTQLMDWFPHPPYDGEKPIFLGEAFSGGNMGPDWLAPFGGDRVYSPTGLLDTWREWTLLRMRAYRDQRFVGFEPFEPFASVRDFLPVDVYPKNYGTAFFGGQRLKRKIKVFNAVLSPRKFKLHWGLEGIDEGTKSLKLAPGGDKEIELSVSLPEVNARTDAVFRLQITEDGEPIPRGGRWSGLYSIFPKRKLERQVAVSSTSSNVIRILKSLGIEAIQVSKASELGKHRFLVTSGEIFHTDREQAFSWIRRGGRALILGQKEDIEELPLRLNRFSNTRSHLIAPTHPIMKGLSQSDFSYWGDDHWIAHSSYSKPLDGSFQVLCETGDELGLGLTPLVEVDEGRGSILYCSLLVAEKLAQQPVAARLLENILMWGALPLRPELKAGAILSDAVTAKLRRDGWDIDDLTVQPSPEISDYTLLWVDAGLSDVDQTQLKGWIQKGGTLVLSRMDPTVFEKWKELIPFSFRLQTSPRDIRYGGELQRNQSCALFEGISNYDLWWKRGSMPRYGPKMRITAVPAEFQIVPRTKPSSLVEVLQPGAMFKMPVGKGKLILDQIRWEEAFEKEQRSRRVFATWLRNLGVLRRGKVGQGLSSTFVPVALKTNHRLAPGVLADVGENIRSFPSGSVNLSMAEFTFPPASKGMVLLGAPKTLPNLMRSAVIPVGKKTDTLHFWHTSAFGFIDHHHGKTIAEYHVKVRTRTGTKTHKIPIRYGQETYEYLGEQPGTLDNAAQVTLSKKVGLSTYVMKWHLPQPGTTVQSIEVKAVHESIAPILLGISVEQPDRKTAVTQRRRNGNWSVAESSWRFTEIGDTGRTWAILGPFENQPHPSGGFDQAFPPEIKVDLAQTFTGKDRMKIEWKRFVQPILKKNSVHSRMTFENLDLIPFKPNADREHWTSYAYTKIRSPKEQQAIIAFGSDDGAKMWVNGEKVSDQWIQRGAMLGQDLVPVQLQKGWNHVLIKIVNCFGTGGFAFDLKPHHAVTIDAWKAKWQSLAGQPSLDLEFDAFADEVKTSAANPDTKALAGILKLESNGRHYTLDGTGKSPGGIEVSRDAFRFDFSRAPGAGAGVTIPKGHSSFNQGTFTVSFKVPKGGARDKGHLASRNAGGSNRGDTFLWLVGGSPSQEFGGKEGQPAKLYTGLMVNLDQEKGYHPVHLEVEGGITEGTWHKLRITWGNDPKHPGFRVRLDGKDYLRLKDYTGPAFNAPVPIQLISDYPPRGVGALVMGQVTLSDRVLPGRDSPGQ